MLPYNCIPSYPQYARTDSRNQDYVKKTILDGAPPGSARAKPATPRKSTGANGLSTPRKRKGSAAANGHGGSASKKPKGDNASDEGDNNEDDLKHVKEEKTDDADADDE